MPAALCSTRAFTGHAADCITCTCFAFLLLQNRQRICSFLFDFVWLIQQAGLSAPIAGVFVLMIIIVMLGPVAAGIASCLSSHYEFTPPLEAASQTTLNL